MCSFAILDAMVSPEPAGLDHIAPILDLETFEPVQAILRYAAYSVRSPVDVCGNFGDGHSTLYRAGLPPKRCKRRDIEENILGCV